MKVIVIYNLILVLLYVLMLLNDIGGLFSLLSILMIMLCIFITSVIFFIKKKIWHAISLLFSVTMLTYIAYLLGLQIPPQIRKDFYKDSITIEEAKKDNSFICEYKLLSDTIHNKYGIIAKSIFVEYAHRFKNDNSRLFIIEKEHKNLIFTIQNVETLRKHGYGSKWAIGNTSSERIILPVDIKDTIVLPIVDIDTKNKVDSIYVTKSSNR